MVEDSSPDGTLAVAEMLQVILRPFRLSCAQFWVGVCCVWCWGTAVLLWYGQGGCSKGLLFVRMSRLSTTGRPLLKLIVFDMTLSNIHL